MNTTDIDAILDFWFGNEMDDQRLADAHAELWWSGSPQIDAQVQRFAALRQRVIDQEASAVAASAPEQLARVLLVDQVSRNLFRGRPEAFAHDALARRWLAEGLRTGLDQQLRPIQRVFFYLPLEHSESLADQEQCLELFQTLLDAVPERFRTLYQGYLDYARAHHRVIHRFGHFPHRNAILGRASTPEEIEFLKQPGSSF